MFNKKYPRFTLLIAILLGLSLVLAGCSGNNEPAPEENKIVKVGATAVPHAEILEFIKPKLEEKGITLDIIVFNDYVQPNLATESGEIDANYFQHIPYLETFSADHKLNLASIAKVHIEPMAIYSNKFDKVTDFEKGSTVAIPNDPTNGGRALSVLQSAGVIKLKDGVGILGTPDDIVENQQELKVIMVDAAQLPRVLDDPKVSGAVINTNYALEADLNPTEDALFIEGKDSPYSNILVVKADRAEDAVLKQIAAELNTEDVKNFIQEQYKGAVVPAF